MNIAQCKFSSPWLGNQLFIYAFARAYAEKHGFEFRCEPWMGERIFQLNDLPFLAGMTNRSDVELDKWDGESNITINGYAQRQPCLIYSRADARRYFQFRPEIQALLNRVPTFEMCGHLRHGDYLGVPGFVAIKHESYCKACSDYGFNPDDLHFVSQENACVIPELTTMGLGFLPDFYQLMKAKILFRANSTFSWWAGTLGNAERIFSPNVEGILGSDGVLRDAPFCDGNDENFTNHCWFTTRLELREI